MTQNYKIFIHSQYIKDLSFENPLAPRSLIMTAAQPNMAVNVNVDVMKIEDHKYEVGLKLYIDAHVDGQKMFIIELLYCGFFEITNATDTDIQAITLIDCPTLLFPFARNVIGNLSREAGLPPVMINPINFHEIYQQNADQESTE